MVPCALALPYATSTQPRACPGFDAVTHSSTANLTNPSHLPRSHLHQLWANSLHLCGIIHDAHLARPGHAAAVAQPHTQPRRGLRLAIADEGQAWQAEAGQQLHHVVQAPLYTCVIKQRHMPHNKDSLMKHASCRFDSVSDSVFTDMCPHPRLRVQAKAQGTAPIHPLQLLPWTCNNVACVFEPTLDPQSFPPPTEMQLKQDGKLTWRVSMTWYTWPRMRGTKAAGGPGRLPPRLPLLKPLL